MAKSTTKLNPDIHSLLEQVRDRAKGEIPSPAITGIVIKSETEDIFVATNTGIVAIPVNSVLHAEIPLPSRSDILTIYVRDIEVIRTLFPVKGLRSLEELRERWNLVEAGTTNTMTSQASETYTRDPIAGYNVDDCDCVQVADDSCD